MRMINNALSGAQAAQVALNTASQNIANQQTPGYSRQAWCWPPRRRAPETR